MAEGAPPENAGPKQPHGWPKGRSGNPSGKPRGTRNRATALAEKLLEGELQSVVRSVIDSAIGGDMMACRLVLDRLVPMRKGRPIALQLPPVKTAGDAMAALAAITAAVAGGEITVDEAAGLAGVLETTARVIAVAELEARVAALEATQRPDERDDR